MPRTYIQTIRIFSTAIGIVAFADASPLRAQQLVDPDAASVLEDMSKYLAGLQQFSARYEENIDIVDLDSEKLKFSSAGELVVARPDKLYASRKGGLADAEVVLDGSSFTIFGKNLNCFLQFPAQTIDAAIEEIQTNMDFNAPVADFLALKPLDMAVTDVISGKHVGMADINGELTHHLAFRGRHVDWQLWVKEGAHPFPLKYVITSKWMAGAPEHSLQIHDWNVAPNINPARFKFVPPQDARQHSDISVDATGEFIVGGH